MAQADSDPTATRRFLRLAAVDGETLPVPAEFDNPDGDLLALRDELRAACDELKNAENLPLPSSLVTRVRDLARSIAVRPAFTIAGMKVKASALQWCYLGEDYFQPLDFSTAQGRLMISLLNDFHRLDAEAR